MQDSKNLIKLIYERAAQRLLFLPHAVRQMMRSERMISPSEIRQIIANGEIIEDYPDDVRGHSCLLMGKGASGRSIHVVCAPKDEYLAIITAYIPTLDDWEEGFKVRKR
ncbi:MAG: DUF4258 domain-containing protein [Thermodesulfobacteriota bacterium]|nr:DUF4258 domain-containing protein [Thermodesulfobacteriota bacterium]